MTDAGSTQIVDEFNRLSRRQSRILVLYLSVLTLLFFVVMGVGIGYLSSVAKRVEKIQKLSIDNQEKITTQGHDKDVLLAKDEDIIMGLEQEVSLLESQLREAGIPPQLIPIAPPQNGAATSSSGSDNPPAPSGPGVGDGGPPSSPSPPPSAPPSPSPPQTSPPQPTPPSSVAPGVTVPTVSVPKVASTPRMPRGRSVLALLPPMATGGTGVLLVLKERRSAGR